MKYPRWLMAVRHEVWWWLYLRAQWLMFKVWDTENDVEPPAWIAEPDRLFDKKRYRAQMELMYRHNPELWAEYLTGQRNLRAMKQAKRWASRVW